MLITLGLKYNGALGVKMGAYKNNDTYKEKIDIKIGKLSTIFKNSLEAGNEQKPSFKQSLIFKVWQTRITVCKDINPYDYKFWLDKGWANSDYYYPTKIKLTSKISISLFKKRFTKLIKEGFIS